MTEFIYKVNAGGFRTVMTETREEADSVMTEEYGADEFLYMGLSHVDIIPSEGTICSAGVCFAPLPENLRNDVPKLEYRSMRYIYLLEYGREYVVFANSREEANDTMKNLFQNTGYEYWYSEPLEEGSTSRGCSYSMCGMTMPGAKPQYTYDDDSPFNGG